MTPNPFEEIMVALTRIERRLSDLEIKKSTDRIRDKFLNVKEAALLLNMSPSGLYRLTMKNQVPVRRVNGRLFFSKDELLQFIQGNGITPANSIKPNK